LCYGNVVIIPTAICVVIGVWAFASGEISWDVLVGVWVVMVVIALAVGTIVLLIAGSLERRERSTNLLAHVVRRDPSTMTCRSSRRSAPPIGRGCTGVIDGGLLCAAS
jgi:hypothetical protein